MSSISLEHDYMIRLSSSNAPSMEPKTKNSDDHHHKSLSENGLNLKATELRLGLPGSESPDRDNNNNKNSFVSSGAKRGFFVAIHGGAASDGWICSATTGPEPGLTVNGCGVITGSKDGLPRSPKPVLQEKKNQVAGVAAVPASKAQVVGWPPIRSFRKNTLAPQPPKNDNEEAEGSGCLYVKVSMDGAPYLRKVDLKAYNSYLELSSGFEKMFSYFTIGQCGASGVPSRDGLSESRLMDLLHGSEYVLTYEDKDGDWMLVGDVPWRMFTDTCRRLRIMKSSEAVGLAPRAMEKCKNRN